MSLYKYFKKNSRAASTSGKIIILEKFNFHFFSTETDDTYRGSEMSLEWGSHMLTPLSCYNTKLDEWSAKRVTPFETLKKYGLFNS